MGPQGHARDREAPIEEASLQSPKRSFPRWKRLPAAYNGFVLPLILSILMTAVISAIATVKNVGVHAGLFAVWVETWAVSWVIAFPTLLVVLPLVRKIVTVLVEQAEPPEARPAKARQHTRKSRSRR